MRQHVVSKVLLRRWAPEGEVTAYNVENRRVQLRSPKREGFVSDFTRQDAEVHEKRWAAIETKMSTVFELLDNGQLHSDRAAVDTLKDFFALHVARSLTTRDVHGAAFERQVQRLEAESAILNSPALLDQYFHKQSGLYSAGSGAREVARDAYLDEVEQRAGVGSAFFVESLEDHYRRFRAYLCEWGLEIGVAAECEFVIGDDPAQTVDARAKTVGIRSGVTIPDADSLVLPLGPHHVAAVPAEDGIRSIPVDGVAVLNRIQIITAQQKVYFRPGAGLEDRIGAELDRQK